MTARQALCHTANQSSDRPSAQPMFPPVDGEVQPHQLSELRVVIAQHGSEVSRPILGGVDGANAGAVTVKVAVDGGSNGGQLGNQVHGVLKAQLQNKIY